MSTEAAVTPVAKPSIAEQFLTEFRSASVPIPGDTKTTETSPAVVETTAETVADSAKEVKTEEPKVEPKAETPTLARRLATLAAAEKRAKAEAEARKAKDDANAPALERLSKAKAAKSRAEAARLALELDDEAEADLFLELHRKFEGKEPPVRDPEKELEAKLDARLEAKLAARDAAKKAADDANLETMRKAHVDDVLAVLAEKGDDFPLVAIAAPSQVDITAISEAWLTANGEIPSPEEVLKLFQDERQTKLDERRKAAEAKASKATAPKATAGGEASGTKAKPIRADEAPITTPRKLSIAEEFLREYNRAHGA